MATSIIKLHTFSGASDHGCPCYLLQVDEFHCLLDCGWCEDLKSDYVTEISKWAKRIDAVLLSHQTIKNIGLLPYLVGKCGLNCPIYATTPVYKMGQLFLYDFYQAKLACQDFEHFSLDDVDAAFDLVVQVKYQQTVSLHGRGHGLCVIPLPSGHTIGGTIWKIIKEDTDIIFASDFNHKKERHLNGATFDACVRPRLLILDASSSLYSQPRRKDRDETLKQTILKTLRRGGNVLIAVDTAGRSLEIAHFLEQCWLNQESGFMAYGLAMLNYVAVNVVDFAKSMVEWMSEKVMRMFEDQRNNPFHFRHMQLCHTLEQLDAVPEPKVVLSSFNDLSCGFSRQLFAEWADSDLNTVILTSQESISPKDQRDGSTNYSLISRLIGLAKKDSDAKNNLMTSSTGTLILPLTLSQRVSCSHADGIESELSHLRSVSTEKDKTNMQVDDEENNELNNFTDRNSNTSNNTPFIDGANMVMNTITETEKEVLLMSNLEQLESESQETNDNVDGTTNAITATPHVSCELNPEQVLEAEKLAQSKSAAQALALAARGGLYYSKNLEVPHIDTFCPPTPAMDSSHNDQFGISNIQITSGKHQAGYDIYPGIHNQAGGQFFRVARRTQLLFPQNDKKIHWDDYGAHLDPNLFQSTEPSHDSANSWAVKQKDKGFSDAILSNLITPTILDYVSKNPKLDVNGNNTRCVTHQLEIPLRCELVYLDYEGRSDGEAMKRILIGLRPQEIILVGNNQSSVDHMAIYCHTVMSLDPTLIHLPKGLDIVNCTKEGDIYQARMKDSLVSSLKFTKIKDYELAWVEATISIEDKQVDSSLNEETTNNQQDSTKNLAPLTVADQLPVLNIPSGVVGTHKTVFVNEPKLSDLKQILLSHGLVAEFVSGVLVVDNCVAIKRSEAGKLLLEDGIMDDMQMLVSRIRSREEAADTLIQQLIKVHAQLHGMRQYQEEILTFNEFSNRVTGGGTKGQLILCLAAENKQLEQLKIENKTLRNSLDEHQTALDMIMSKYRYQVSKLMKTNQVEQIIQTVMHPDFEQKLKQTSTVCSNEHECSLQKQTLNENLNNLIELVHELTNQGDVYATELEEELRRLQTENSGLRELLSIQRETESDSHNANNNNNNNNVSIVSRVEAYLSEVSTQNNNTSSLPWFAGLSSQRENKEEEEEEEDQLNDESGDCASNSSGLMMNNGDDEEPDQEDEEQEDNERQLQLQNTLRVMYYKDKSKQNYHQNPEADSADYMYRSNSQPLTDDEDTLILDGNEDSYSNDC